MKSIFALLGVCLALGCGGIGCGEAANATSDVEPVLKAGEEECEMCRTPGSRASFLKAALAEEKRVANVEPLTAEEVTTALAEEIIRPDLALEEVQVFNETRVPDMPRVRTAEEWQTTAAAIRKQVLIRWCSAAVRRNGGIPRCGLNGARRLKICPDTASRN